MTEDHILILNLKGDMGKRSVETNRMLFQYFSQLTQPLSLKCSFVFFESSLVTKPWKLVT